MLDPDARDALAVRMIAHLDARHPGFVEPGPDATADIRLARAFGAAEA